ncbi:GGDEF domain-containing protein [Clostridium grantii]|uniref:Diguanylate cyclase (GGDEF) domain-containing protein n=1 Tax=Clostridium grantii DSM 8605 TaxID=1121316 RepID=A0A1M5WFM1_9CLOT|nr:GGDEF domain-containing protein [Clostridium grantii]SHH86198.1 diguanylate cyclase (GGDEF) domain-containing protein [Clostridium grantii DSM 8605]
MNIITQIDLYIYSAIILLIIYFYIKTEKVKNDLSIIYFELIIYVCLWMLILEAISWVLDGNSYIINYWLNWILLLSNPLPLVSWLLYFDYKIHEDHKKIKKNFKIYMIPFIIIFVLLIYNNYNPIIFTIDNNMMYTRLKGMYIFPISEYSMFIIYLINLRKYKNHIDGRLIKTLLLVSIVPSIAALIQIFVYGVTLSWATMGLMVFITFIYVERETLLKDQLTGLSTRAQLENRLAFKLKRKIAFSIIMIDMNDFKVINDTYGHDEGDIALKTIASILHQSVKREDMICRYGGDEFVLLVESDNLNAGELIIARIQEKIKTYNNKEIKSYKLSISCGSKYVHLFNNIDSFSILRDADKQMYRNKMIKKNMSY